MNVAQIESIPAPHPPLGLERSTLPNAPRHDDDWPPQLCVHVLMQRRDLGLQVTMHRLAVERYHFWARLLSTVLILLAPITSLAGITGLVTEQKTLTNVLLIIVAVAGALMTMIQLVQLEWNPAETEEMHARRADSIEACGNFIFEVMQAERDRRMPSKYFLRELLSRQEAISQNCRVRIPKDLWYRYQQKRTELARTLSKGPEAPGAEQFVDLDWLRERWDPPQRQNPFPDLLRLVAIWDTTTTATATTTSPGDDNVV